MEDLREFGEQYKEAKRFLRKNKVSNPSDEMIANVMGMTVEEFHEYRDAYLVKYDGRENISKEESAIDRNVFEAEIEDIRTLIRKVLNPAEMKIIIEYFYNNKSFSDIAKELAVNERKIIKIFKDALSRLKSALTIKGLDFEQLNI